MLNAIDYRVDELPGKPDNSVGEVSLRKMMKMIEKDYDALESQEVVVEVIPRTLSSNNRELRLKYLNRK